MSDIVFYFQHALMLPVLVNHVRYFSCLHKLESVLGYSFKEKMLLKVSLSASCRFISMLGLKFNNVLVYCGKVWNISSTFVATGWFNLFYCLWLYFDPIGRNFVAFFNPQVKVITLTGVHRYWRLHHMYGTHCVCYICTKHMLLYINSQGPSIWWWLWYMIVLCRVRYRF